LVETGPGGTPHPLLPCSDRSSKRGRPEAEPDRLH
jgi:hypothetical protein